MQSFEGTVISAKTPKTVAVAIDYYLRHAKYKKIMRRTTKLLAHNENLEIKEGDKVTVVKSRPYSKQKHFIVTGVIARNEVTKQSPEKAEVKVEAKLAVNAVKKITRIKKVAKK
jgi:small subunit ribosomal protein S17